MTQKARQRPRFLFGIVIAMSELLGIDLISLIQGAGYIGLFAIIFAESGVFLGFFLPGDSLIFTAGFLSSQGFFNVWVLAGSFFIAAVLGDSFGYWFGRKMGERMYAWPDRWYFKKEYLKRTEHFYEEHGKMTIILARFIPIVRTFAPILAGAGQMHYPTFLSYNIVGAALWAGGMTFLGFAFGSLIPSPDKYLLPVVAAIIVVSIAPALWKVWREHTRPKLVQ